MSDKILTEAFDKMKAIEESEDPFCIGAKGDQAVNEFVEVTEDDLEPSRIDHLGEMEKHLDELRDGLQELEEIQRELGDVKERLSDAIRSYAPQKLASWQAYGLARLSILIGNGEYMAGDESIQDLITKMEEDYQATKEHMGGI